jgi:hypothetical protein
MYEEFMPPFHALDNGNTLRSPERQRPFFANSMGLPRKRDVSK